MKAIPALAAILLAAAPLTVTALPPGGSASPHGAAAAAAGPVKKVPKAAGPDARTVEEVVKNKAALKGKTVLVNAQVVKVTEGVMGKNWVHLQDGSGQSADGTHDVIATTKESVAVGAVLKAKGTVRTDVNLGAGYSYPVLIEDASFAK